MNDRVSSVMSTNVVCVDMEATIEEVEKLLDTKKLSCVPVIDAKGEPFGVLTLKDLTHARVSRINPKTQRAWEACTYRAISVNPATPIREAAELLASKNIHHLLVTEHKHIVGIVSTADLVRDICCHDPGAFPHSSI